MLYTRIRAIGRVSVTADFELENLLRWHFAPLDTLQIPRITATAQDGANASVGTIPTITVDAYLRGRRRRIRGGRYHHER